MASSSIRGILPPVHSSPESLSNFRARCLPLKNPSSQQITCADRWHFLKRLPHKLLRDIAMVISCPPLLIHSCELPLVCADLLGGGSDSWSESAKWLDTIDLDHVKGWFETKRNNGRLGQHFAFCIEYILLFSPMVRVRNLITSQQVTHRGLGSIHEGVKDKIRNEIDGACNIIVEKADIDVLVKSTQGSSFGNISEHNHKGSRTSSEAAQSEVKKDKTMGTHQNRTDMGKGEKKLRKTDHLRYGKGPMHTIGEFDFLFMDENPATKVGQTSVSSGIEEIKIFHWEVSVKFLLYAGPWEMFGLETPSQAAWRSPNEGSVIELEREFGSVEEVERDPSYIRTDEMHRSEFLGCFLGPHVGETLYDRKMRLKNQISLANNMHAATLLWKLFVPSLTEIQSRIDHEENVGRRNNIEHIAMLRVSPRALLKGYLFYEYELWRHLQCKEQDRPSKSQDEEPFFSSGSNKVQFHDDYINCRLNVNHWMGWWTRLNEFLDFAESAVHNYSKWYIVPKLEWLSPVVIGPGEVRTNQLLDVDELMIIAAKVQEEAERNCTPRKRRFLLAEMIEENGFWTEISRGFLVEDTWPDSRLYKPHGYTLSWSPTCSLDTPNSRRK